MTRPPFRVESTDDSAGLLLWQATTLWQRQIRTVLDPHDLAHPQFVILALLMWCEVHGLVPTQTVLANFSKLDKMNVSNALKNLAGRGLVQRTVSQDTRAKDVRLTPKGRDLAHTLVPLVEGVDADFFGRLDAEDHKALLRILGALAQ